MDLDSCSGQLEILRVPQWSGLQWLLHGFSTRIGGVSVAALSGTEEELKLSRQFQHSGELNLGFTAADDADAVAENRRRFLEAVEQSSGAPQSGSERGRSLVTLKQMHSNVARRVGRADAGERASPWGDALLADEPGVLLGIQTADCLPILIADRKRRAVAAVHAGWRGTWKGIACNAVAAMRREFGSLPDDLTAAIGPGIGSCCFVVGHEVEDLFAARFAYAGELFASGETMRLDLVEANRRQLAEAGVPDDEIFALKECTSCHSDRFFSYRKERGRTGRMMSVAGIRA